MKKYMIGLIALLVLPIFAGCKGDSPEDSKSFDEKSSAAQKKAVEDAKAGGEKKKAAGAADTDLDRK